MDRRLVGIGVVLAIVIVGVVVSRPRGAETFPALTAALEQRGYDVTALGDVVFGAEPVVGGRESIGTISGTTGVLRGTRLEIRGKGGTPRAEIDVFDRHEANVRVDQRAGTVLVDGKPIALGSHVDERTTFLNRGLFILAIGADDALARTLAEVTGDSSRLSHARPAVRQLGVLPLAVSDRIHLTLLGTGTPVQRTLDGKGDGL